MDPESAQSSSRASTGTVKDKAEKTSKKVSRACNTCRLKRKKCDGLDPCRFCTETKVECSYSREPRRRGPPSGYLRYTETRVNVLETLLGLLCVSYNQENTLSTLVSLALTLKTESTVCTQDVWDRYKAGWLTSQAAAVIEDLTLSFAPFVHNRGEGGTSGEGYAKPLLPPTNDGSKPIGKPILNQREDRSLTPFSPQNMFPPPSSSHHSQASVPFSGASLSVITNHQTAFAPSMLSESFERTQSARRPSVETSSDRPSPVSSYPGLDRDHDLERGEQISPTLSLSRPYHTIKDPQMDTNDFGTNLTGFDALDSSAEKIYTGSYWRTAEFALEGVTAIDAMENISRIPGSSRMNCQVPHPSSLSYLGSTSSDTISSNHPGSTNLLLPTTAQSLDLPPPHILTHLIDVYYTHIHPTFPILPDKTSIENILHSGGNRSGSLAGTALGNLGFGGLKDLGNATTCMLLSMCAYAGRLSPNTDVSALGSILDGAPSSAAEFGIFLGSGASKLAADLWYEQAREAINALLRKPAKLETVQALILLALRDYGKGGLAGGGESQAWLLVGTAIRLGQELDLPASASFSSHFITLAMPNTIPVNVNSKFKANHTPEEHIKRGNLWGIATMLDGFLSLQLGRTPAVAEALKARPHANFHPTDYITNAAGVPTPNNIITGSLHFLSSPPPLFAYSYSLFQIISKINFWLYLGFGPTSSSVPVPSTDAVQQNSARGHTSSSNSSGTVTPILTSAETENSLPTQTKLSTLRAELDGWLQTLPIQFRISIGAGPGTKEVLEINMFYYVAVILLYRPFVKDRSVPQVIDIFLDAASTFNLLLEKYKNQYSSDLAGAAPLSISNPHLIYLIFTVALAHLSGYKSRLQQTRQHASPLRNPQSDYDIPPHSPSPKSRPASAAPFHLTAQQQTQQLQQQLQTQLHLMNCLDALKAIGGTWELARRCWRTLDQLIDKEGLKPGGTGVREREYMFSPQLKLTPSVRSPGLGKRKREGEDRELRSRTISRGFEEAQHQTRNRSNIRSGSSSFESAESSIDIASTSKSGIPSRLSTSGIPHVPVEGDTDNAGLETMDWTTKGPSAASQTTFDIFSSGWLSDFETEYMEVGAAYDQGQMDIGSKSGGWGLPMTGLWNGWGDPAWEENFFLGKDITSGFDAG